MGVGRYSFSYRSLTGSLAAASSLWWFFPPLSVASSVLMAPTGRENNDVRVTALDNVWWGVGERSQL